MQGKKIEANAEKMFCLLPEGERRWRSFGAGFFVELAILGCALWMPLLFPKQMVVAKQFVMTRITAPIVSDFRPQPTPKPRVMRRPEVVKEVVPDPPKPKLVQPVFESLNRMKPVQKKIAKAPELNQMAQAMPDDLTKSLGSSAPPDLKKPREPVQMGGFGDPNGLPAANKMTQPVNVSESGAFNLPQGAGKGNGRGGTQEGVVASAGFGNDSAANGSGRRGGNVQEGMFADAATAQAGSHVKKVSDTTPDETPVVIESKPRPKYSAEGMKLKIQGEVVLQVIFKASGEVQVLRVVRGLGHGLDENAEVAARKIQFKPAMQDGHAVDFPATVRIEFELAY